MPLRSISHFCFFFFNDTATTEIYTLSLHDALPISRPAQSHRRITTRRYSLAGQLGRACERKNHSQHAGIQHALRSEEHTSELQSQSNLVCRLLLEKKKTT